MTVPTVRRPWLAACLCVAAPFVLCLASAIGPTSIRSSEKHAGEPSVHDGARRRETPLADAAIAAETLRRFAVNLLLVPLIDDGAPARWADVSPDVGCLDAEPVRVDGRPLVAGAPLPARAFVVERRLAGCALLRHAVVDGAVTLHVHPDDAFGLTAIVEPHGLRVTTWSGQTLQQDATRFVARETHAETQAEAPVPVSAPRRRMPPSP
jgi:hypothetical protein